jgi:hypothetical protein
MLHPLKNFNSLTVIEHWCIKPSQMDNSEKVFNKAVTVETYQPQNLDTYQCTTFSIPVIRKGSV